MAKNNDKKTAENTFQNTFAQQAPVAQAPLTNMGNEFQNQYNTQFDLYKNAAQQNMGDYGNIMGGYQNFLGSLGNPQGPWMNQSFGSGGGGGGAPSYTDPFGSEYGGYANFAGGGGAVGFNPVTGFDEFAKTGGFSDQNIADLRARGIAPTRAVYANAQENLNRNRALQGYSPNYAAATAKMARELAYGISDTNVNVNAGIAQMQQQGRLAGMQGQLANSQGQLMADEFSRQMQLAGLGGMSDIDKARLSAQLQAAAIGASRGAASDALNERWQEALLGANLGALGGMTNLYGTTPGLTHEFGQELNATGNQQLGLGGLQNQLSLGLIGAQGQNVANIYSSQSKPWYQSLIPIGADIGLKYLGLGGFGKSGPSSGPQATLNSTDPFQQVGNAGGFYSDTLPPTFYSPPTGPGLGRNV